MDKCPVCHSVNLSDEHLLQEYKAMMSARYGTFKHNAIVAQDAVAEILLDRGITHFPNMFGDIPIKKGDPHA